MPPDLILGLMAQHNMTDSRILMIHDGTENAQNTSIKLADNALTPVIRRVRRTTLDREISSIDLNPLESSTMTTYGNGGDLMEVDRALQGTTLEDDSKCNTRNTMASAGLYHEVVLTLAIKMVDVGLAFSADWMENDKTFKRLFVSVRLFFDLFCFQTSKT